MRDYTFFEKHMIKNDLSSLLDDIPKLTYFMKDSELRYVAYNERIKEIFEVDSAEEIMGKRDEDFLPGYILENIKQDDLQILKTGDPIVGRVEMVPNPRGGSLVEWTVTTKKPLLDGNGNICGVFGITHPFEQGSSTFYDQGELSQVVEYLQEHFRENVEIPTLAKMSNISMSAFINKFKKYLGMTPKEYIRNLRIQDASYKLRERDISLIEISQICGFSDQSHFSREFKKVMGETPARYRKNFKPSK